MIFPALALFSRSLRLEARAVRPHLVRWFFAAFLFAAMVSAHLTSPLFGAPGVQFFAAIVRLNFAFITLAAVGFFSTAITEEKEEQTLGLLRLAGVGTAALLLGKSTSRLLTAALILAVQVPFSLLAVTLGGVSSTQIAAASIALLAYLVFAANLGLFCSVVCRTSARATALTGLVLILLLAAPPVADTALRASRGGGWLTTLETTARPIVARLLELSVWTRLEEILATGFGQSPLTAQVAVHLAVAVGLFAASWGTFGYFAREGETRLAVGWQRLRSRWQRRRRASRRAWSRALSWKEFQFGVGGVRGLAVRLAACVALALLIVWGTERYRSVLTPPLTEPGVGIALAMALAIAVELSVLASRVLRDEVRDRTLFSLVLLPASSGRLVRAKLAGRLLGLIPAATVLLAGIALAPNPLLRLLADSLLARPGWLMLVQFVVFLFVTARLSLSVRWGALALAACIMYVLLPACGAIFLQPLMAVTGRVGGAIWLWELVFVPLDLVGAVAVLLLYSSIARKLTAVAGE